MTESSAAICWYHKFAGDTPCGKPGRWYWPDCPIESLQRVVAAMVWCDAHRHSNDVPLPDSAGGDPMTHDDLMALVEQWRIRADGMLSESGRVYDAGMVDALVECADELADLLAQREAHPTPEGVLFVEPDKEPDKEPT